MMLLFIIIIILVIIDFFLIYLSLLPFLPLLPPSLQAQVEVEKSGGIFGEAIRRLATNKDMKVVKELLRAGLYL